MEPYSQSHDVIEDRARWSIALLDSLLQHGRHGGWVDGDPVAVAHDHDELKRNLEARRGCTPLDPRLLGMEWLAIRLRLDVVQLDTLWLLAAIELSPAVSRLADAFGGLTSHGMTVQLLHQLLPLRENQLDALAQHALIELPHDPAISLSRRRIRVNDRVVGLVRGELDLDREIRHLASLHAPLESALSTPRSEDMIVVAVGPDGAGCTAFVAKQAPHRGTLHIRCTALSREDERRRRELRAIIRECLLFDVVPIFQDLPGDATFEEELADVPGLVLATSSDAITWKRRPVVIHEMSRPAGDEARRLWGEELGSTDPGLLDELVARYRLWPGAVQAACRNARAVVPGAVDAETVHAGVRAHLGDRLRSLATRVEWKQTWSDLVLPRDQLGQIAELIARVKHRTEVLDEWGFGAKIGKGHGVAALLSGPPGTGKTMVAGLIARELGLDLYQADLSKITSKYIGETEKQLGTLFDAAETGQSIILFDEADSLFAKRSEVKSSNDRYANLEVNFLLQRLESFTGIVLLTTNHERSIDEAFRRRLSAHIRFPVPDEAQREGMWRAMLPAAAKVAADIDFAQLAAEFDLSGGYIKNAALRAAYLAAYEQTQISMRHMWSAARIECEALGRIVR